MFVFVTLAKAVHARLMRKKYSRHKANPLIGSAVPGMIEDGFANERGIHCLVWLYCIHECSSWEYDAIFRQNQRQNKTTPENISWKCERTTIALDPSREPLTLTVAALGANA